MRSLIVVSFILSLVLSVQGQDSGLNVDMNVVDNGISDDKVEKLLRKEAEKVKEKKEDVGSKLAAAGIDWTYIEEMKKMLRKNPDLVLKLITGYLKGNGILNEETMPMVNLVGDGLLKNAEVVDFFMSFLDSLELYFKSEAGRRLFNVIPKLMNSDAESAMEMFAAEADYNQEAFFNLLQNGDMARHFVKQIARFLVSSYQWSKAALNDNLKMAIVNGMLISNNFPPLNKRHVLKSSCAILEKCVRLFTTYRPENDLYSEVRVVTDEFEKQYFKFEEIEKLTEDELVNMLSQFLSENMLEPVKDAYLASKHVTAKHTNCAEMTLCLFNQNFRKTNDISRMVSKGISMVLIYSWTSISEDSFDYDKLYQALSDGLNSEKTCQALYEDAPKDCDVFALKKQQLGMNLNYDHVEL